jgi:hypothetical protein
MLRGLPWMRSMLATIQSSWHWLRQGRRRLQHGKANGLREVNGQAWSQQA